MRRFLSVWLPHWSIESRLRDRNQRRETNSSPAHHRAAEPGPEITPYTPFALTQNSAQGLRIMAVNQAAEVAGITKGMPLTDARALAANLITEEATPDLDTMRLRHLALWCLRYSPLVTARVPDDIFIDITGCAHLFGGENEMMAEIQNRLNAFNITARVGIADTMGASWAAAHYGPKTQLNIPPDGQQDFLSGLPISALRLKDTTLRRLHQLGLRQVQMLLNMPTAPLTARFGPEVAERLHQATGRTAEVFNPLFPPPDYSLNHPFIEPVLYLDGISYALEELTDRMSRLLDRRSKAARRLQLNLFRIDGHLEQILVNTSRPCHEASHMLLLFRERLTQAGEKMDAGFGYDLMTLSVFDVEERREHQSTWNPDETNHQESLNRLLDRFGNRFGFDHINSWHMTESHIPERAFKNSPAGLTASAQMAQTNSKRRPLLLLPRPAPITVLAEVPDGPPIRFEWRRKRYLIIAAEGPERLAPEWWQQETQDSFQTRDYYRVEDKEGYRFWIYRDGLYERTEDHPRWFLQGWFS